ncbi:MAG: NAD(P)H-binding protein [Erysipelotrichaceae bacterium]|nr:NAD(P)H-binding protein [Erysipelotrichaceae bacterium]MBQ1624762.1 NAD(P)H-binding protein [Erysipelotrichaceae bacterium]MBQ1741043.1 NAD(P)H-binding protein [Erysipelotrichaceae bacterium]MBQ1910087.1 NAD(P)H-binding protein [Erysipelotrichaceae bacterium]MEE3408674.1 NAD(P)H-binding protein [Erysipelotrichaceae bacterium]
MKVLLAGAFGNLGFEILKQLVEKKYEVIAADLKEKENNGLEGKYTFKAIDATNPETLKGICDGVDTVITTMGLTTSSTRFTAYDIDYQGNLNLYNEAKKANVRKFNYISVISCDEPGAEKVPMLHAKYMLEQEIKKGDMSYVIYRPTGYFYDIAKVFKPYVDKGEMQLLKGYHNVKANVVDCPDFAKFIVEHMDDENVTYNVGGKETYTYEEMAKMCFRAAGKPVIIKDSPVWMFSILANLPKIKKEGKHDIIMFSKWTLSHDLVGDTKVGEASFAEYIKDYFGGKQ